MPKWLHAFQVLHDLSPACLSTLPSICSPEPSPENTPLTLPALWSMHHPSCPIRPVHTPGLYFSCLFYQACPFILSSPAPLWKPSFSGSHSGEAFPALPLRSCILLSVFMQKSVHTSVLKCHILHILVKCVCVLFAPYKIRENS